MNHEDTGADAPPEQSKTLDPSDWPGFRTQAHRMLDDILDYVENIRERPVWQPIPDEVRSRFRGDLPRAPSDLAAVHGEFLRDILPFTTGNVHPGFMGWVHGGGTPVSMLAELLAGAMNANCGGRDHVGIAVERQVIAWAAQMLGMPVSTSGVLLTDSSMANFVAVLCARYKVLGDDARQHGPRDK